MLILSRRRDEKVIIECPNGDMLEVMVVDIRGDKVRLGFAADEKYQIHRKEIWDEIVKDGRARSAS